MTLAPLEERWQVSGVKGAAYKVGPWCANPFCTRMAQHAHHIVRRGFLTKDYDWISIDGWVVGNLTGLCVPCHNDITGAVGGHKAAISIDVAEKKFYWATVEEVERGVPRLSNFGLLEPQPPTPELLLSERALGQGIESEEHCPFCGSIKRRRREQEGPAQRRRRKTWTVAVPDDSEDGAEILDSFVADIEALLGVGHWEERHRRYWALVHALAWVEQHRGSFEHDWKVAA
jgi:hypothetical protein